MILFSQNEVDIKNFMLGNELSDDISELYTWNFNEVEVSNNKYIILINRRTYFSMVIPDNKDIDLSQKFDEIMRSYFDKLVLASLGIKVYLSNLDEKGNIILPETRNFSDILEIVKKEIKNNKDVAEFDDYQLAEFAFDISKKIKVDSSDFGQVNAFSSFILATLMGENDSQLRMIDIVKAMLGDVTGQIIPNFSDNEIDNPVLDNDAVTNFRINDKKTENVKEETRNEKLNAQKEINNDILNRFKKYLSECGDSESEIKLKMTYIEDYVNFYLLEQHNETVSDDFDMLYFYFTAFMPAQHIYVKNEPLSLVAMQQFFEFLFKCDEISQDDLNEVNDIFNQIKKKFDLK